MKLFICFTLLSVLTIAVYSQPKAVNLELDRICKRNQSEGIYIQKDNATLAGCPCYENERNNRILFIVQKGPNVVSPPPFAWYSGSSTDGTCTGDIDVNSLFQVTNDSQKECNILIAQNDKCYIFSEYFFDPVPTLSQWGIILLSLSFLILGVLGLRSRSVILKRSS